MKTTLPGGTARDLRGRLRDAHVATFNTLNTIFTGGLLAFLLRRVIELPAGQRPWLMILASLLVIVACWSGLFRTLALIRYPSRMSDAVLCFGTAGAAYVMVAMLDAGPRAWLQAGSAVAFFGGLGTLNMLHGGRKDPFNDAIIPIIETDMRRTGFGRIALVPLMLLVSASPLSEAALTGIAVAGAALSLAADDFIWSRAVAHAMRPDLLAEERNTRPAPLLSPEKRGS
jgi:hypothetical protein